MNGPAQSDSGPAANWTAVRTFNTRVTNGPLWRTRHGQASTTARHSARRRGMTRRVRAVFPGVRTPRRFP